MSLVFNGDSNGQDIVTLINDYCNTNNVVFPLAEKARMCNVAGNKIWSEIFDSYAGWQYDDTNQTALPEDVQTLTSGTSDYTVPNLSLTIIGIDIRYNGAGANAWSSLIPLTKEEIRQYELSDTAFSVNNGTPFGYELLKDKIRLIPAPNYTQTLSLRTSYDRGSVAFVPTDTTKTPGFAGEFHYGLALGAAVEWAKRNATSNLPQLQEDYNKFVYDLKAYYAKRFKDHFPTRITFFDTTQEYI